MEKDGLATLLLPLNYPIPLIVKITESVVIGAIDDIGEVPDGHRQQSQHRQPDDISS
jgi:hypothetical protein